MAYVGHSSFSDVRGLTETLMNVPLLARCGLVAVGAAAVVLALSGAGSTPTVVPAVAVKGDRLAAPRSAVAIGDVVYLHDVAARVTMVSRNANTPLAADSPMLAGLK